MPKPPPSPLRRAVNVGVISGIVGVYLAATGILERFEARTVVSGLPAIDTLGLGDVMMMVVALAAGYLAGRRRQDRAASAGSSLQRGLLAGAIAGGMMALFLVVVEALIAGGLNVREILVNVSPPLRAQMALGQTAPVGALLLLLLSAALGIVGAASHLLREAYRRPLFVGLGASLLISLSEPLLNPMLRGLEVGRGWLYQRGGLSRTGLIIVLLVSIAASYASQRVKQMAAADRPSEDADDPAVEAGGMTNRDLVAFGLGIAALVMSVVLVAMAFADVEIDSTLMLIAFLLSVAAVIVGAVVVRLSAARGGRGMQGFVLGGAALAILLPQIVGGFVSDVLGTVGLYVLLGLGLNIVVGYAGLLDLGYVAFFAVGAYAMAILTSPASFLVTEAGQQFSPDRIGWTNFWFALPLVVVIAVIVGVLIGAPVLRLRGDYLAIVTLGFGEIIRTLVLSDWLAPVFGGAQGLIAVPAPPPEALDLRQPERIYYLILAFVLIAAFISVRLVNARVGRAWAAMREDESVAEAMGVSVIKYKLLAFAMGAGIGCLGGTFFAGKIGSIFPNSFGLIVSINVLAVIILGGMGSIPGVIVGALVLVGLPEFLREFAEYRLLIYGAILVAIMIYKPEGLLPNVRRKRELETEQLEEEQYQDRMGPAGTEPVITTAGKEPEQ